LKVWLLDFIGGHMIFNFLLLLEYGCVNYGIEYMKKHKDNCKIEALAKISFPAEAEEWDSPAASGPVSSPSSAAFRLRPLHAPLSPTMHMAATETATESHQGAGTPEVPVPEHRKFRKAAAGAGAKTPGTKPRRAGSGHVYDLRDEPAFPPAPPAWSGAGTGTGAGGGAGGMIERHIVYDATREGAAQGLVWYHAAMPYAANMDHICRKIFLVRRFNAI